MWELLNLVDSEYDSIRIIKIDTFVYLCSGKYRQKKKEREIKVLQVNATALIVFGNQRFFPIIFHTIECPTS